MGVITSCSSACTTPPFVVILGASCLPLNLAVIATLLNKHTSIQQHREATTQHTRTDPVILCNSVALYPIRSVLQNHDLYSKSMPSSSLIRMPQLSVFPG